MGSLYAAILEGEDVRPWLERGHSPNVYADFPGVSWTPLHLAVFRCLPQVAQALLEAMANPNSQTLPGAETGPYASLVGMTAVDIAVTLDSEELVRLLVRHGGRPSTTGSFAATGRTRQTLRLELDRARSVGVAESLVVEPILLPLVEKAQRELDWDEADRLLQRILCHEGEGEQSLHLRIRGLLARGKTDEAMEEASLVFVSYRRSGRYLEALQVARSMRLIDGHSGRPYELEMEFLTGLGWMDAAQRCLHQLLELYRQTDREHEMAATKTRFAILGRRPKNRGSSRPPTAWSVPEATLPGNASNLPAVPDGDPRTGQWWDRLRRLWWGN